jgi:programmed cell death protein 5
MENLQLPQGLSPQGQPAGAEEESKRKAAEDDMRRDMIATILDNGARERCPYNSSLVSVSPSMLNHVPRQYPASHS